MATFIYNRLQSPTIAYRPGRGLYYPALSGTRCPSIRINPKPFTRISRPVKRGKNEHEFVLTQGTRPAAQRHGEASQRLVTSPFANAFPPSRKATVDKTARQGDMIRCRPEYAAPYGACDSFGPGESINMSLLWSFSPCPMSKSFGHFIMGEGEIGR
jgi:hypothetical protein